MTTQQRSLSTATIPMRPWTYDTSIDNAADPVTLEDMQHVAHLLELGQVLCKQVHGSVTRLCNEVKSITQGRAQLCLGRQRAFRKVQEPPNTLITLPVQFGHLIYGTLCISFDPNHSEQLSMPLPVAQLLAQTCSWLLYTLEQSAFVQGQCQQLDYQVHGTLTKREREVLALMCRGHNQESIAEVLSIAPATVGKHRQHIYEQLGVHSERDALLAAYHVGFFSLIEENVS